MSAHTHTPGPFVSHGTHIYTVGKLPNSELGHDPACRLVAVCPDADCGSDYTAKENLPNYEEAAANARLIAAAPEMLAERDALRAENEDLKARFIRALAEPRKQDLDEIAKLRSALAECVTESPGAACYNTGGKTRRLEAINAIVAKATGGDK